MELNDNEYKEFKAMKKQSRVVDRLLLIGVALFILWLILTLLSSFAVA